MRVPRRRIAKRVGHGRGPRRIVILCEGKTEKIAVEKFVRPRWDAESLKSIALDAIDLKGKHGDVFENVARFRSNPEVLAVFTLIDLYRMGRVVHKASSQLKKKVGEVRQWLEDQVRDLRGDDFFHPHVSVHEVEAWLLADGKCLGPDVDPVDKAEEKDFQNPPKARVNDILKRRRRGDGYREVKDGTTMFKKARFEFVYQSCPYFKAFYDDLKEVAEAALRDQAI